MELIVPAPHSQGGDVGDAFPVVLPSGIVAPAPQLGQELIPAAGALHGRLDHRNQLKLPALSPHGTAVLPRPEAFDLFLLAIRLQGGQSMLLADLIADQPHPLQGPRREVELFPGVRLHGVHHQVGVEVRPVDMCGHQHFAAGEELFRQLLGDLVGLRRCDVLLGREGLDVVVEPGAAGLAVQVLCSQEALIGQIRHAVDPGEIAGAVCVHGFLLLGHVPQDAAHGAGGLLFLTDEAARRYGSPPALPLSAAG